MSGAEQFATRTYLELSDPQALRPRRALDAAPVAVNRYESVDADFWRWLYATVGASYNWMDRLPWTDADIDAYLREPAVSLWVLTVGDSIAGYFELRLEEEGSAEIVYFGLLPAFTGRGLGGYLLTQAVERAWTLGARRVWLHTCSFDHPAALQNYLARGFTIFKTEQYTAAPRPNP
jgi:GNAT superfamily N-acetyltransferase